MRWPPLALWPLAALLLAGCPREIEPYVELYSFTSAPPALAATVVSALDYEHSIRLTQGAAIGVGCWDNCDGVCVDPTITVNNPELLEVRPVYRLGTGTPGYVLVAKKAGDTGLTVTTTCSSQLYTVDIIDQTE